jgi:IS4 transposase
VSRIKSNSQPLLIEHCSEEMIGRELQEVGVERGNDYDMEGMLSNDLFVRVIGIHNAEEDPHWWYLTNIPRDDFSADEIQGLYRLRWEVELFFRSLKHILNVQKILNQEDKSKIRSQIYYVFCYYLLIHLFR